MSEQEIDQSQSMLVFEEALVPVRWPEDAEWPPVIHCPVTGQVVSPGFSESGEFFSEPDYEKIPTLMFFYTSEAGEFHYIRPELEDALERKREQLIAEDSDNELLSLLDVMREHPVKLGACPLVFEVDTPGLSVGPEGSKAYVGLDLYRPYIGKDFSL